MKIIKQTSEILNQTIDLIQLLDKNEYTTPLGVLNTTSVGQHFRHIVEFYIELINGYNVNLICYDNRKRNLEFETKQNLVITEFNKIIKTIKTFDLDKQIKIKSNHGEDEEENSFSQSSILRELIYSLDHTVHHLAIIKIAIQSKYIHLELDPNLGVAPSTIRNNKKLCAQ
jgi:hypothetical protein